VITTKKITLAVIALSVSLLISAAFGVVPTILSGQQASNEISMTTTLNYPISITQIGSLPSSVYTDVPYTFHIAIQNMNPSNSYPIKIEFEISQQIWIIFPPTPIYSSGATNSSGTVIAQPFINYTYGSQLTPDMVTLTFNNTTVPLTYNSTENSLIGYSGTINANVGFFNVPPVTVLFNDSALSEMNTWTISIWAVFV